MIDLLTADFFINALFAGLLASIACGIIGTYVVVNRIVFITGGITHSAYGGLGLAVFLGLSPLLGALFFAVATAIAIAYISYDKSHRTDTFIGVLWAFGMAFGIIMLDLTPGYNVDLMSYLFGSILAVSQSDIIFMSVLNVLLIGIVIYFFKDLLLMSFDRDFAATIGVNTKFLHYLLMILIAVSVVMVIRVVGIILVIALMTIPPYIAEKRCSKLSIMMVVSVLLNILFVIVGLMLAARFNLSSGAAIIMTASAGFVLSEISGKFKASS